VNNHLSTEKASVFRRFLSSPVLNRSLFAIACVATLIGLFYTEENWRGKRAWEKTRRELEATGAKLNWKDYIQPHVPDDQNFFKAPKIAEWFLRKSYSTNPPRTFSKRIKAIGFSNNENTNYYLLAELKYVSQGKSAPKETDKVWRLGTGAAQDDAQQLLKGVLGPVLMGSGSVFLAAKRASESRPIHVSIEADVAPSDQDIRNLFPDAKDLPGTTRLRVENSGGATFNIFVTSAGIAAADYLSRSDQARDDLELIRKALERPYAQVEDNSGQPFEFMPDFIAIRNVAQTFAARAQCYLLLDDPESALREVKSIRDLCRMLEAKPTGKPILLVSAMIDVAVTGLYGNVIGDGLHLHKWREQELSVIQEDLKSINLLVPFVNSVESETASSCVTLEKTGGGKLATQFRKEGIKDPRLLLLGWGPRGWIYENMAAQALHKKKMLPAIDLTHGVVLPQVANRAGREIELLKASFIGKFSPSTFLMTLTTPNFIKALQAVARNQTMVNEAMIACALERYRLAHNDYPENLAALMPQFQEQLPHDIVNGQGLKYRRDSTAQFLLYSVGWNERDDGGITAETNTEGDWVWRSQNEQPKRK